MSHLKKKVLFLLNFTWNLFLQREIWKSMHINEKILYWIN